MKVFGIYSARYSGEGAMTGKTSAGGAAEGVDVEKRARRFPAWWCLCDAKTSDSINAPQ